MERSQRSRFMRSRRRAVKDVCVCREKRQMISSITQRNVDNSRLVKHPDQRGAFMGMLLW